MGPEATRLLTARTNDGEWWLVSVDEELSGPEWKDFQAQFDGSLAPMPQIPHIVSNPRRASPRPQSSNRPQECGADNGAGAGGNT